MEKVIYKTASVAPDSVESGPLTDIHGTVAGQDNQDTAEPEHVLTDAELDLALPKPCGFRILIALPEVKRTFENSQILKVNSTVANETVTSVVAAVLDMGPDAYQDKTRFPNGPYCKVGDYILIRPYQGTRFIFNNREFRIINDDAVEGVVADPTHYRRI